MEETFDWSKIHIKGSITCKFLEMWRPFDSSCFTKGYKRKTCYKKINKRGVFSIAVSNTKQSNTCTQSKALYPPNTVESKYEPGFSSWTTGYKS